VGVFGGGFQKTDTERQKLCPSPPEDLNLVLLGYSQVCYQLTPGRGFSGLELRQ
jgi:hypothetical protein